MLKSQAQCTSAELHLGDRVLDEVEKDSFIVLPGEGGHRGIMPLNPCLPTWGR